MKKFYCDKCQEEKTFDQVTPKISQSTAFTDMNRPEVSMLKYPILCLKCGAEVRAVKD